MFKIRIKEATGKSLDLRVEETEFSNLGIEIEADEGHELAGSSKVRTRVKKIIGTLYLNFKERARVYVRAILHNTGTTEFQIRQTVEPYKQEVAMTASHEDTLKAMTERVRANPEKTAEDMFYLLRRAIDLDAQLLGMQVLLGTKIEQDPIDTRLKGLIWRCFDPFKKNFWINFIDCDDKRINVDFRLFNCAMYHFFDNIKKYILPGVDVDISCDGEKNQIIFKMTSRALEEGEEKSIFLESYSGRNSGSQKGEGFGMYIFKEVLEQLKAIPEVTWDRNQPKISYNGNLYQVHFFYITFPPSILK